MSNEQPLKGWRFILSPQLVGMCLLALVLGVFWWAVAREMGASDNFLVWDDQRVTFLNAPHNFDAPYDTAGFVNPPWTLFLLTPLTLFTVDTAIFMQIIGYFVILALMMRKFGGGFSAALIVFTSPLAIDAIANLNIDWLIAFALLVPRGWSGPFLLVKPQIATGYILSFRWRTLVHWLIPVLAVVLLAFLVWGWWIPDWLTKLEVSPVTWLINLAPRELIGDPAAFGMGAVLAVYAVWKRDPLAGVVAGLCVVPYVASYSLLLPFALLASRSRLFGLVISLTLWALLVPILSTLI